MNGVAGMPVGTKHICTLLSIYRQETSTHKENMRTLYKEKTKCHVFTVLYKCDSILLLYGIHTKGRDLQPDYKHQDESDKYIFHFLGYISG